jgi:hypothetical protein
MNKYGYDPIFTNDLYTNNIDIVHCLMSAEYSTNEIAYALKTLVSARLHDPNDHAASIVDMVVNSILPQLSNLTNRLYCNLDHEYILGYVSGYTHQAIKESARELSKEIRPKIIYTLVYISLYQEEWPEIIERLKGEIKQDNVFKLGFTNGSHGYLSFSKNEELGESFFNITLPSQELSKNNNHKKNNNRWGWPISIIAMLFVIVLSKYFGIIFLIYLAPCLIGWYPTGWYIKKFKNSNKAGNVIAWANVVAWIIPLIGFIVAFSTLRFRYEFTDQKKYLALGLAGLLLSITHVIATIYVRLKSM